MIGLVLRFGTGAEALAWGVMFVLLPLSGVFYPIDALPAVLQPLALALPTTHAFDRVARARRRHRPRLGRRSAIAAVGSVVMLAARVLVPRAHAQARSAGAGYITRYT